MTRSDLPGKSPLRGTRESGSCDSSYSCLPRYNSSQYKSGTRLWCENIRSHSKLNMWNRLEPFLSRLLDIWNYLTLYFLRLLGRHDSSPRSENEADDNIDLYSQMMDEKADSGTTNGGDYDVFLSFRGPDTRHRFTDCLYEFMCQAGIRVYRDREELQPGEKIPEILRAVKSSQIFIAVFSNGYASSKWCLEELLCMVESIRRSPGKKIFPVFYDVDPLDVKLETKLYKSALNELEERYGSTRVDAWKEALKTVGRFRGWHLKDQG